MMGRLRRFPLWARWTGIALAASIGLGRWLASQPPGPITAAILQAVEARCPAALPSSRSIQIADGAQTLDRLIMAIALEALDGRDRCGRND